MLMRDVVSVLFICLMLLSNQAFAQDAKQMRGKLIDEVELFPLKHGVIMILQAQDSIKKVHTRSKADGTFQLPLLAPGEYTLWASYPDYVDFVSRFKIDSADRFHDFGPISMKLRAKLLEEVLITGVQAIKIKGDTTEFDPRAFVIEPHAKVEDLLRQFPGIQIDENGNITAQGKRVTKVLVDGEEFFGDDPTLVTRNLRADMIDKVQLYEKKSDQAEFTGVDDGQRTTTLNMVLKEDKKRGHFGKVDGGMGTNDMYASQGMFNRFNDKLRFATYLTVGNAGRTGLDFSDAQTYGGGTVTILDGGAIMVNSSSDEFESFDGRYNGRGIPEVLSGGLHFSNKWLQDKHALNSNYKYGQLGVNGTAQTIQQNLLPTGTIHHQNDQIFDQLTSRHKWDARYEYMIDSSSNLAFTLSATSRKADQTDNYTSLSLNEQLNKLNEGIRNSYNQNRSQNLETTLLWRKKLKKAGRSMSWNFNFNLNETHGDGQLYTHTTFFKEDELIDSVQIIDQKKLTTNNRLNVASNITYNEPLSKRLSLVLNYAINAQNGTNLLQSLNADQAGRYAVMDSLFSNDFHLNQFTQQMGATFNYRQTKHTLNIGGRVSNVAYQQVDRYTDYDFSRSFFNFNPSVYWTYRPRNNSNLSVQYSGNNQQPGINQLQPVRVNTDPLNLYLGNLDLKPSFGHSIYGSYYDYRSSKNQNISASVQYSLQQNPIVNDRVTDSVGRSVSKSINLMGKNNQSFSMNLSFSRPVTAQKIQLQLGMNYMNSVQYAMVNSAINTIQSNTLGPRIGLNKYAQSKYSINLNVSPSYNFMESSLQRQQNNNGWSINGSYNLTVYLPLKTTFYFYGTYQWNAATQAFAEDFSRLNMIAMLERSFFKDRSLKVRLSGNDLLNQNQGFSRSASASFITQSQHTTISRYYMAMLIWDFNKMGGKSKATSAVN
jgi:hypothetical protein